MPELRHSEHIDLENEFTRVQKAKLNLHKFYTFILPQESPLRGHFHVLLNLIWVCI